MGDGLMISFTGENHAQRGVQTAINIVEIFSANEHTERTKPLSTSDSDFSSLIQLSVSIGINSGEAMLAAVGGQNRKSLTYIGETVNIAAHVEAETRGSDYNILITETTFKLLGHRSYEVDFIKKSSIKGRSKEIELYGVKTQQLKKMAI
jgi:class 3 adenylate cyclase